MSGKDGGYVLPSVINPPRKCVTIELPDNPGHISAFLGAILELTFWNSWQRDDQKLGKDVAYVWFEVWRNIAAQIENLGLCMTPLYDVRQNVATPCILEKFDGENWTPFADLNLCDHDHLEYVAINPNSLTRNLVQATGNYPALIGRAFAGQTVPLLGAQDSSGAYLWYVDPAASSIYVGGNRQTTGRIYLSRSGTAVPTLIQGTGDGVEMTNLQRLSLVGSTTFLQVAETRTARITDVSGLALINIANNSTYAYLGIGATANANQRLLVQSPLATVRTAVMRLIAAQTAYLLEFQNASSVFLSGIDEQGRFTLATGSGKPTDTIVRAGTTRIDASAKKLWIKGVNSGSDDWFSLDQLPSSGIISEVNVTMVPAGQSPSGEVDGDTINIEIPYTEFPPANNTNYWFLGRQDRPLSGESIDFDLVVLSDSYTMFPCSLEDNDRITVLSLRGWWDDTNFDPTSNANRPVGYDADGKRFDDGLFYTLITDPYPELPHMCPVLEYQNPTGGYEPIQLNALTDAVIYEVNGVNPFARIFANKASFTGAGGIQLKLRLTAVNTVALVPCEFSSLIMSNNGFFINPSGEPPTFEIVGMTPQDVTGGVWRLGQGFVSTTEEQTQGNPSGNLVEVVAIVGELEQPTIGGHGFTFNFTLSGVTGEDISIRGQRAIRQNGTWILGNLSNNAYYGNGSHSIYQTYTGGIDAVGLLLHNIPTTIPNDIKITITGFNCEAL